MSSIGFVEAVRGSSLVVALQSSADVNEPAIGDLTSVAAAGKLVVGLVQSLRRGRRMDDHGIAEVVLLGEIGVREDRPWFARGVSNHPRLGDRVRLASSKETAIVFAQPASHGISVGTLRSDPAVHTFLQTDALLGRHFSILGSTGSGKSCAVTIILDRILEECPYAHVLLLDPHGEYPRAFNDRAHCMDVASLQLPFWMLTIEELSQIVLGDEKAEKSSRSTILKNAVLEARRHAAGDRDHVITVDTPVPYHLSKLTDCIKDAMGKLEKADMALSFRQLISRIESLRSDRRYEFLFPRLAVRDNMNSILADLLRVPGDGRPMTIIDLSGVPSEVIEVVVSLLCRIVFEIGSWASPAERRPMLLVCEEAHRYVPCEPQLNGASRRAIERIAKEGRKYGVSLCLVSQRPAELSASALSQCGTILAMRLASERDQSIVRDVLPEGSEWLVQSLPALATGEAVVAGEGVTVPLQIRLHELPPDRRPASNTPSFSRIWGKSEATRHQLASTIERWREQRVQP